MFNRLTLSIVFIDAGLAVQGCALIQPAPQDLVQIKDHAGLATFYREQAQDLREKAKVWDTLAESYERHRDPHGKLEPEQHAAHCRAVAASHRKAADEADALASGHQQELPHGVVQ